MDCISKGKAHRKYEFGCKVSVVTISKDNWIVGAETLHNNPFDGHTQKGALKQARRLAGWDIQNAYCDKGTKGDKMNAILASCGFNLRKLLRAFLWLVFKIFRDD
jgi:IS5 family transposase